MAVAMLVVLSLADADAAQAALLGLTGGCLVAAIALAVVLTYRGSGVVNFASGAIAMFCAYVYASLRSDGTLFLPPLPADITLGGTVGFLPALAITLAVAALVGALVHLVVFRPLRDAPPLAKVVASVGLLVVLQAVVVLRYQSTPQAVAPVLHKQPVALWNGLTVPSDLLVVTLIVLGVTAVFSAVSAWTRFGVATRASAENERAAALLGYSADRLAAANWVLSALTAGGFGVLVATVNGSVDPSTITLLVVPALAGALVGGLRSFAVAAAASLLIAMGQGLLEYLATRSWFPTAGGQVLPGLDELVPFAVVLVVLLVRGAPLPARGSLLPQRLPAVPGPKRVLVPTIALSLLALGGLALLAPVWRLAVVNSLIGTIICLSLVVITGYMGQISLAQMAIAGVSGFALSKLGGSLGVPFPLAPLLGAMLASAAGLLAALPALRVRGIELAILTLAAAVAVEQFVFRNPTWAGTADGAAVGPPRLLGLRFGPGDPAGWLGDGKLPSPWFGVFCLVVCATACLLVANLRRSSLGRRMLAVRSDERAAASAGISVTFTKLAAFALAAFIAGLGGALSGYRFGSVSPLFFGALASLSFLAYAYLGGITSVGGAVLGGTLVAGGLGFTALRELIGLPDRYTLLISGLALVATAVLNPEGMAGALRAVRLHVRTDILAGARRPVSAPPRMEGQ